jgi:hypothetical protein
MDVIRLHIQLHHLASGVPADRLHPIFRSLLHRTG